MPDLLTTTQALALHWVTIALWLLFASWATYDAVPLWIVNRRAYRASKKMPDNELRSMGIRGELRRSRNFMLAFFLAALPVALVLGLNLYYGAEPDTSGSAALVRCLLVAHIFFCWRAKHADAVTFREQRQWIEKHRHWKVARVMGFAQALANPEYKKRMPDVTRHVEEDLFGDRES